MLSTLYLKIPQLTNKTMKSQLTLKNNKFSAIHCLTLHLLSLQNEQLHTLNHFNNIIYHLSIIDVKLKSTYIYFCFQNTK
jgi:hypothetical protein